MKDNTIYSMFGWSLNRQKPPPQESEPPPEVQASESPPSVQAHDDNKYFIIESRFNIIVVKIIVVSLKVFAVVVMLIFILSQMYPFVVRLRFLLQNVAVEAVPICMYFLVIVVVLFVVSKVGNHSLNQFFD